MRGMKTLLLLEDESNFVEVIQKLRTTVDKLFCGTAELVVIQTLDMAKHVLASKDVSLVVMDLTLPDSVQPDTIDFIAKNHRDWPPIFVITGDERIEVRRECLFAGASGFAIKKHVVESPNFFFASLLNMYLKHIRPHENGR